MEQALVKTGTLNLIKPECPTTQLLQKISEMRQKNLTAEQQQSLETLAGRFGAAFGSLTRDYLGLNVEQILSLSS
ncbi:MAG: hypothetical protein HYX21_00655 [Candidatus Yanofskybacteria bacterium]|nr:hypothetical protein [Candidatus Yanofskybacteria bacterium]